MRVDWNEDKRQVNLHKHGFDFRDAEKVFAGRTVTIEDMRYEYGEARFITLGLLRDTVVVIVHTEEINRIRVISMRKANKHEEQSYFE